MPDSRRNALILAGAVALLFFAIYYEIFLCTRIYVHDTITWYGAFHYFVDSLSRGHFPFWDPYLIAGTHFYPYISLHGNLDPIVLAEAALMSIFDVSPVTLYIYFRLLRLFIFVAGEFFLFRHITKSTLSAVLSASILLFVFPLTYFRQFGAIDAIYLTPFALFFLLRFLEDPGGPRRYLYVSCITLISGVSMAIYIPAFYLFNFIVAFISAFLLKIADFRAFLRTFRDRKFALFFAASLCAVIMMTAPSLSVMFRDASGDGELFPMQRIIQRNEGMFKKIIASDINTSNLSNKFTNLRALYNTWGEIVNLLFPDFVTFKYWQEHDLQSEIDHYVGVIPLVFAILGFIYFKSRYKYFFLILLVVNFINGFSATGFGNKQYNFLQEIFNVIFPPLKMYQGRENLGYFVLMYLCVFVSMGLSLFFRDEGFVKERYRLIIKICVVFVVLKVGISWYFAGKVPATSSYDLTVLLQIIIFAVAVFFSARGKLPVKFLCLGVIVVVLADFYLYNENAKEYSIQDSRPYYELAHTGSAADPGEAGFQFFREPALTGAAFVESITKTKGAISLGLNHSLFTTKRYYDFLTHVPLLNQFLLDGVVYPVMQFFPMDRVITVKDKHDLLNIYASENTGVAEYLFVEDNDGKGGRNEELKDFSQYENVESLRPENIFYVYERFSSQNGEKMRAIRENVNSYLSSPSHYMTVRDFSANEVTVSVNNREAGYLYYNDGWSRYWQAFDGRKEIPVKIANYNFKAVYLDPGEHEVRFVFNPVHYKIGLMAYFTGLSVSILCIGVFFAANRRRRVS